MDLTRAIGYRGFAANTVTKDPNNVLYGCEVKQVEYPGVPGAGYSEKKAQADGFDASDVFLGKRLIGLTLAVYGRTRGECYDYLQQAFSAFTPTAAYDESPGDKGYLPLDFYVPTANIVDFPAGYIHKQILARPVRQPTVQFISDTHGGVDTKPLAIQFTVLLEAKDPRVYAFIPTNTDIGGSSGSGDFTNLGDYPSPLNILLVVTAGSSAGSFHFVGGGSDLTIAVPDSSYEQIVRYSAADKVLTIEANNVEVLHMDYLDFAAQTTHPLIPVGTSAYQWSKTAGITLDTGSRFWHWDAWA